MMGFEISSLRQSCFEDSRHSRYIWEPCLKIGTVVKFNKTISLRRLNFSIEPLLPNDDHIPNCYNSLPLPAQHPGSSMSPSWSIASCPASVATKDTLSLAEFVRHVRVFGLTTSTHVIPARYLRYLPRSCSCLFTPPPPYLHFRTQLMKGFTQLTNRNHCFNLRTSAMSTAHTSDSRLRSEIKSTGRQGRSVRRRSLFRSRYCAPCHKRNSGSLPR